jgi:NAD+ synthase
MAFRIILHQARFAPGAIEANLAAVLRARMAAPEADLLVFPELYLAGGPVGPLLRDPAFENACRRALDRLAEATEDGGPAVAVGVPWVERGALVNALAVCHRGRIQGCRSKVAPIDRGLLDERDLFAPAELPGSVAINGTRVGFVVGSDLHGPDVAECLVDTGAEILVVAAAFPFVLGGRERRMQAAVARVVENGRPLALVNGTGPSGALLFDGAGFALDADRRLIAQLPPGGEASAALALEDGRLRAEGHAPALLEDDAAFARAAPPGAAITAEAVEGSIRHAPAHAFAADAALATFEPDPARAPAGALAAGEGIDS